VTSTNPGDIQNGPLAKAGQDLIAIYEAFEQNNGATLSSDAPGQVEVSGSNVGVDIRATAGNFSNVVSSLNSLGMQIQVQNANDGVIEGLLPIGQLLPAAQNSQVSSISAVYIPIRE
jgi:hypothetical protein